MSHGSKNVALAALIGNLLIAVSKLIAAILTGSAAIFAETLHSFADTANQILLLVGLRRSERPANAAHPFGYGKEQYFWAFVVAIVIFALGSVFSLVEGVRKVISPQPMQNPVVNFAVLGLSILFEGGSLTVAMREFNRLRAGRPFISALLEARDAITLAVVLEDLAALAGLTVAIVAVTLAELLHQPVFDGAGSIVIGLILAAVAYFLASAQREFLVGKGLPKEDSDRVIARLLAFPAVVQVTELATMHLGPELLLCANLTFAKDTSAEEVVSSIDQIEVALREMLPGVKKIYLEADGIAHRNQMSE